MSAAGVCQLEPEVFIWFIYSNDYIDWALNRKLYKKVGWLRHYVGIFEEQDGKIISTIHVPCCVKLTDVQRLVSQVNAQHRYWSVVRLSWSQLEVGGGGECLSTLSHATGLLFSTKINLIVMLHRCCQLRIQGRGHRAFGAPPPAYNNYKWTEKYSMNVRRM